MPNAHNNNSEVAMTEPIISIKGLSKLFGKSPEKHMHLVDAQKGKDAILAETGHSLGLNDINLDIYPGEIFVIMGLSGSGKSTLIRHFNRLIDPTRGQVIVNGDDIMAYDETALRKFRQKKMSMVFQRFGLMPHYTVVENVAFGLNAQGVAKPERTERAMRWINDVGLAGYENQFPAQLSGGQQQRVGLARALCTLIRSEMPDQLVELQEKLKKTVVFITHDLDEALRIGDRIAMLKDGCLVQVGTPADILLNPADSYVESFVRDVNRSRALTVDSVMLPASQRISAKTVGEALAEMRRSKHAYAFNVNKEGYQGALALDQLEDYPDTEHSAALSDEHYYDSDLSVGPESVIETVIPETLEHEYPLPVVDSEGELLGELSRDVIVDVLTPIPSEEADESDESDAETPKEKV
jgi:glycine betaine/proline transport system ATP-binding protein